MRAGGEAASRSWAILLARIYENRQLQCPRCGGPMGIIAYNLERAAIVRILRLIAEETEATRSLLPSLNEPADPPPAPP